MNDSPMINKIENLLKSKELLISNDDIRIEDQKTLIQFKLGPKTLDIRYPSAISSKDLNVNGGEIERLYKTVEKLKWGYLIDFLNNHAWQATIYKPKSIDDAEKSLVNFVESFNRTSNLGRYADKKSCPEKGSWVSDSSSNNSWPRITWINQAGISITFSIFPNYRTETTRKFLLKKTNHIHEENVRVVISKIPNNSSSWTWEFKHKNDNRDALIEAVKKRQKAIVSHSLSLASV